MLVEKGLEVTQGGTTNYLPGLPEFPTTIEMHSNAKQQGKAKSK